jgi:tetratricopeptide (TPR) repeat protein
MTASEVQTLRATAERSVTRGDMAEAIARYRQLLSSDAERADDWYNLGYALRTTRHYVEALDAYGTALARGIAQPEAVHVNRAAIYAEHLQRPADALAELKTALTLAPGFQIAALNLAQLYEDVDDRAGARRIYADVVTRDPANARGHARLAALDVIDGRADDVSERLKPILARTRFAEDAAELGFALGNALDAAGRYDAAFAAFEQANVTAWRATRIRYDPAAHDRLIDTIIAAHPVATSPVGVNPSAPRPIFICGMFRSGSTLCEQVLARHSEVTAAGELETIPAIAASLVASPETSSDALAARYLTELNALFPGTRIVTDKRCDNFLHIGLIKTMFPGAVIVHTKRAAVDNVLSVWFLHFADTIAYGWRLDDIVHYYRAYRRLMAHWQRLYPDIVTFDYDTFVGSPLTEAQTLFAACRIDWESEGDPSLPVTAEIRTASAWQVRQPVHRRSAGRWQNYTEHVADLKADLDRA